MDKEQENQGFGVLLPHLVIAKEYLRQNKMAENNQNMVKIINKLGKEKANSYTPNPELGKNPESRVSNDYRQVMAPFIYKADSHLARISESKTDYEAAKIELGGAVNGLSQIIMKRIFDFKTTRRPGAKLSDPKQLTSFEYIAKGPDSVLSSDEQSVYNKNVDVHRLMRYLVEGYLFWAITPLLNMKKKEMESIFLELGVNELDPTFLRSKQTSKEFIFLTSKLFGETFSRLKIKDYYKGFKWMPRSKKIKKSKAKKS